MARKLSCKKPESKIQAEVLNYLKSLAPDCKAFEVIVANERGIPDVVGCYKGLFFVMEIKSPGEQPIPIQRQQAYLFTIAGGQYFLITSVDEAKQAILKLERIIGQREGITC